MKNVPELQELASQRLEFLQSLHGIRGGDYFLPWFATAWMASAAASGSK